MILEQLVDLIIQLRRPRSVPLVIWFVDRPATYYNLLKQRDPQYEVKCVYHELQILGIPIRQFSPSNATKEELKNRPYFCSLPGVWVEMSDRNHIGLKEKEDDRAAY